MATASQPVGPPVEPKEFGTIPARLEGTYVTLEHVEDRHAAQIWQKIKDDPSLWTYMLEGPFDDQASFAASLTLKGRSQDPYAYAIIDNASGQALGYLAYLRIDRAHRSIEVGHVLFSKAIQRTRGATESFYLLIQAAFDLNVRRLEWKCNNLNLPSRSAAARLGFLFEGVFRQHYIVKGLSRDSAWFSILDSEWPVVGEALRAWLHPSNFDEEGVQRKGLAELRNGLSGSASK